MSVGRLCDWVGYVRGVQIWRGIGYGEGLFMRGIGH